MLVAPLMKKGWKKNTRTRSVGRPFPTARTLTTRRALADEIDRTRARGWPIDTEEIAPGIRRVSRPIHDAGGAR